MIHIAPDRTQYPENLQATISPELEPLTGADMLISNFPLPFSKETLQAHIDSKALFVQIKVGYDLLNFEGLHNFCARIQASRIPKNQAILLRIGDYWRDDNGLLRVTGSKPYGNTTWRDYRKALIALGLRGVTVFPDCLRSMDELLEWIEDYQSIIEKIYNEGKRELYPSKPTPQFDEDDIWQEFTEVNKNDPRYVMVAGLDKFGEKKAISTFQYIVDTLPHIRVEHDNGKSEYLVTLYQFWKVLTDEDEKGKAVHNIPGIGDSMRKSFRNIIGLGEGYNLSVKDINDPLSDTPFKDGWVTGLKVFEGLMNDLAKENGNKLNTTIIARAFDVTMKQSELVIEF